MTRIGRIEVIKKKGFLLKISLEIDQNVIKILPEKELRSLFEKFLDNCKQSLLPLRIDASNATQMKEAVSPDIRSFSPPVRNAEKIREKNNFEYNLEHFKQKIVNYVNELYEKKITYKDFEIKLIEFMQRNNLEYKKFQPNNLGGVGYLCTFEDKGIFIPPPFYEKCWDNFDIKNAHIASTANKAYKIKRVEKLPVYRIKKLEVKELIERGSLYISEEEVVE